MTDNGRLTGAEPGFLSPGEQQRLAGLRFEKRKRDWLLGRWCAKILVADAGFAWAARSLDDIQVLNDESGAPCFADLDGGRINGCLTISHREGAAFCAFTADQNAWIGADLEWVEPKVDAFLSDYFTPPEQEWINSLSENLRPKAVCLAWSAKEAVMKALRTGLRTDPLKLEMTSWDGPAAADRWGPLSIVFRDGKEKIAACWTEIGGYVLTLAQVGGELPDLVRVG
jgi:4'-phosphopantetheinyl transferase